ncbi:MAG: RNA-directed DNA polymerase [Ramlibacter sp.]
MPERLLNLVEPLAHKATAMHTTGTAGTGRAAPGAVAPLIGAAARLRPGDVDSSSPRSTRPTTPGSRTSSTATATTTTRTTSAGLWPSADSSRDAFSFEQLVQAWLDCRRTKRNSESAQAFERHAERHLVALHEQLLSGQWRPGRALCFVVTSPKCREVWAAPFRDRIVHHLLYGHIGQRFEAAFVHTSSACIPGRGTLFAARALEHQIRSVTHNWQRPAWYLKCDLANFFVAIDKHVLWAELVGKLPGGWWRELAHTVLFHDPRADYELRCPPALLQRVPAHKRLVNAPADTGLPIGNLSSQFFANVLLNVLDQHAKHQLRARHYGRYVDDFYLLDESPQRLHQALTHLTAWLPERLHCQLNPRKTILQPLARGMDFVGHVIKPWARTTRPRTVTRAHQRLQQMPCADVYTAGNSYLGLLGQASHSHQDRAALANLLRRRGHAVAGDLSKIYRSQPE